MGVMIVLLMDHRVVMKEDVMKVLAQVKIRWNLLFRNYIFGIS